MKHSLVRPFKDVYGVTRDSVELRDYLTGGDILFARRQSSQDPVVQSFHLLARCAGLVIEDVECMDVRDIEACMEHVESLQGPKAQAQP